MDAASAALDALAAQPSAAADALAADAVARLDASAQRGLAVLARTRAPQAYPELLLLAAARLRSAAAERRAPARANGHAVGAGDGGVAAPEETAAARRLLAEWVDLARAVPGGYVAQVPLRWVTAAREAARLAVATPAVHGLSRALVLPLRAACEALAPSDGHSLPLYADYLAVCVHAQCYDAALYFHEGRGVRTKHDPLRTCVSAADVLCEQYYLVVVHAVCRRYKQALRHCRLALAVPSSSLSDVAVAVYRKFLLLSLLHTGALPAHPRIASYTASRLKAYAAEYVEFGKAFAAANFDDARKLAASHRILFLEHANLGLVERLLTALPRRKIASLTSSFLSLSLADLAARARLPGGAPEAERVLADMAADGAVPAKIDARAQTVRFAEKDVDGDPDGAAAARAAAAARVYLGAAPVSGLMLAGGRLSAGAMGRGVDEALACVERVQGFRDAVLCDPAFVSRKFAAERDSLMHASELGVGMGIGIEDADRDID